MPVIHSNAPATAMGDAVEASLMPESDEENGSVALDLHADLPPRVHPRRAGVFATLALVLLAAVAAFALHARGLDRPTKAALVTLELAEVEDGDAGKQKHPDETAEETDGEADGDDGNEPETGEKGSTAGLEKRSPEDEEESKAGSEEEESSDEDTPPPCKTAHADDSPSFFCWAVMFEGDKDLIKSTFTGRAGIFACNDYGVISPEAMVIGKDDCGVEVATWETELPKVEKGQYGVNAMTSSWLNVPVFLICWDLLLKKGKVWEQDFTVKLDPDTVFFPDRLGVLMKEHVGKPVYTTDCRYWGGDPVGKLFGSLEVVSKQAVGSYKGNADTCKDLGWQGWGEDYWLQHCMDAIGVPGVIIADQVTDGTCPLGGSADCADAKFVALHPYKDAGAWWDCWKKSNPE